MSHPGTALWRSLIFSGRLPWRYRAWIQRNFGWYIRAKTLEVLRRVHATKPVTSNSHAAVAVHSVVGSQQLDMYLIAIKSLLRFFSDVAVVVHDDGTLSSSECRELQEHVRGLRIISRETADKCLDSMLAIFPNSRLLRSATVNALQLFDFYLLSSTERLISLDADVIFLRPPEQVIQWITRAESNTLYQYEPGGTFLLGRHLRKMEIARGDLNAGLVCTRASVLDLVIVERFLKAIELKVKWEDPQAFLDICVAFSGLPAVRLPADEYVVYASQAHRLVRCARMVHFVRAFRYSQMLYANLALKTVKSLM